MKKFFKGLWILTLAWLFVLFFIVPISMNSWLFIFLCVFSLSFFLSVVIVTIIFIKDMPEMYTSFTANNICMALTLLIFVFLVIFLIVFFCYIYFLS